MSTKWTLITAFFVGVLPLTSQQLQQSGLSLGIREFSGVSGSPKEVSFPGYGGTFPHVAFGGPWKTVFVIVNPHTTLPANGTLEFYASNGDPLTVSLAHRSGISTGTRFTFDLGPRQTLFLQTVSSLSDVRVGFANLTANRGRLIGNAIFRATIPDRPDLEAVVPLETNAMQSAVFSFDNTNGFVTSVAIANSHPYGGDCNLVVTIYNETGDVLGVYRKTLKRHNHTAFETNTEWPVSANQRGSIKIAIEGYSTTFSALALLFNPTGAVTSALVAHGW
jgi:hypothetical protein